MSIIEQMKNKARLNRKTIVLPEGSDPRTVRAARMIADEGIADVVLLGKFSEIASVAKDTGVNIDGIPVVNPQTDTNRDDFINTFYEMRKAKGVTPESAAETMNDPLYYGAMMVHKGLADGMVAGAINSTGNVLRPGLQIIRTAPGIKIVSSCFVMEVPDKNYGQDGVLIFGDCAVNPNPSAEDLAAIAISSAQTAQALVGMEPKVAMLSFSTKGSAKHELVDKVVEATAIVKQLAPDLQVDGELQADAALVESVGKLKSPGSTVAGQANCLIFPDLQSGNIGYKLVQRLAGAEAIGPICQGFAKPVNDLSRGCSAEDIVMVVAVTSLQVQ